MGRRLGLGKETVRRWAVQADIDAGARPGVSTDEAAEIKRLKAENRRLTEDLEIMRRASIFFAGELDPPQPVICEFIEQMRAEGHGARVDLPWPAHSRSADRRSHPSDVDLPRRAVAARVVSDAEVEDVVRQLV